MSKARFALSAWHPILFEQAYSIAGPGVLRIPLWQAALVFAAATGVRLLDAGSPPVMHDELYTILAARSYASEGSFRIWDGAYTRAPAFTMLVGWSIAAFGDTLLAARLPSVLCGALLVVAAFLWLYRTVCPAAGWAVAVLLCFSSFAIHIAQFARFYALHGLLFWLGAIAVYAFVVRPHRALDYGWLALAAVFFAAAYHLQTVTLIGITAVALWAIADMALQPRVRQTLSRRTARWALAMMALAGVAAIVLLPEFRAQLAGLYAGYRWAALWNAELQDYRMFYVHQFAGDVPILFYLFPIATLVATAGAPRPALFCLTVSMVALVLHSFAGMKALRYAYYTYPFVFSIWAIAAAVLLPIVAGAATTVIRHARTLLRQSTPLEPSGPGIPPTPTGLRAATAAVLALALLVALAGNPDFSTVRTLASAVLATSRGEGKTATQIASQTQTRDALLRLVQPGRLVVTSNELASIYFLGRYDVLLRVSRLDEFAPGREFARDPRTGGPVIGTVESFRRVMQCYPTGILLVWANDWRLSYAVSPEIAEIAEATMQEVNLPGNLSVRAFQWQRAGTPGAECNALREVLSAPAKQRSADTRRAEPTARVAG